MPKGMNQFMKVLYRLHFCWCMFWTAIVTAICSTGFILSRIVYRGSGTFKFWGRLWSRLIFIGAGFRLSTSGGEKIDLNRPHVYVSNHQNSLDIPLMLLVIPQEFGFVAKASLEKIPFLGWAISRSPSVFVDTRNPRRTKESIDAAAQSVANGQSVLVYPEGRRSWCPTPAVFKRSAFTLAGGAGVGVVPIAIENAYAFFDEKRYLSRPGRIKVILGETMYPSGTSREQADELSKEARQQIISLLSTKKQSMSRIGEAEDTANVVSTVEQEGIA
jgi:1-acyl-sn-glycerol-3-phosphate acyltransferase